MFHKDRYGKKVFDSSLTFQRKIKIHLERKKQAQNNKWIRLKCQGTFLSLIQFQVKVQHFFNLLYYTQ